jgi:hypothetical protein
MKYCIHIQECLAMPTETPMPLMVPPPQNVLDDTHLKRLYDQTRAELAEVKVKVTELEEQQKLLEKLQLRVAHLEGLERQLSYMVEGILPPEHIVGANTRTEKRPKRKAYAHTETLLPQGSSGAFFPEKAYAGADEVLQYRHSVNYEIFRAVVLNGGQASTRDIRDYLIEHKIKTPAGKTFEATRLSEVSARTAYLVKKGVIQAIAPGRFQSCFGWE